jgi:hypothetical protein
MIHDLAHSTELDCKAMSSVRGGALVMPNVNVAVNTPVNVSQVSVVGVLNGSFNHSVIGAPIFLGFDFDIDQEASVDV